MFQILRNFLWRQKAAPYQATYEGYLPYFANDSFPLEWHKTISESPSGQACVSTIADFMEGLGFSDENLDKLVVNSRKETFFKVHHDICASFAEFEGFYLHFMFTPAGQWGELRVLPFESCRLGKPDSNGLISKIYYNPFYGTKDYSNTKKDTVIYDTFNPEAVKAQIQRDGAGYNGQVLFVGTTTASSRFYPLPEAYSAQKWMRSETGIADFHEDNINNGLLQPYILVMKGDPNAPVNNPEDGSTEKAMTAAEQFEEVISHNFQGADRVGNMWVQWVNSNNPGEETPEVIPLPSNANGDFFIAVDNQATKKITVAFKVPAILANINEGVSLGGDGNMVRVAVKLMQQRVIKKQRILTDTYEKILKLFTTPYTQPVTIIPYNPYPELEKIDPEIWNTLRPEEKRKWIEENTEIVLIEEEPVVTDPVLPAQSGPRNALPIGFPDNIRNHIKRALDHDDVSGKKCSRPSGRKVAEQILNNETMGQRQLKRILSYLKKRPEMENRGFEDCEAILYHQWGGKLMEKFLDSKLDQIDQWLN
jgi:hypothetical protein